MGKIAGGGGGGSVGNVHLRDCAGDFVGRFMITVCIWVGQSVFRLRACNPELSFAPATPFARVRILVDSTICRIEFEIRSA